MGHLISARGVEADPAKVEAIRTWPAPTTVTEVRSFLGLAGHCRRHVRDFATIATPLTNFMRTMLYNNWVGCTGYGEKTAMFPDGVPTGCSQDSQEFQITFQATKALTVAIVAVMALLGTKTMGMWPPPPPRMPRNVLGTRGA